MQMLKSWVIQTALGLVVLLGAVWYFVSLGKRSERLDHTKESLRKEKARVGELRARRQRERENEKIADGDDLNDTIDRL